MQTNSGPLSFEDPSRHHLMVSRLHRQGLGKPAAEAWRTRRRDRDRSTCFWGFAVVALALGHQVQADSSTFFFTLEDGIDQQQRKEHGAFVTSCHDC